MDHYCPWVGGVVGENSFKFFVQFVAYAFFYCLFVVVVAAIYLSEDLSDTSELNGHFVALVAISGFFGLFTLGMTCSSLQFVFANLTTIENLSKKRRAWIFAVLIPPTFSLPQQGNYPHITYPLPLPASEKSSSSAVSSPASAPHDETISDPEVLSERDTRATRTFAILQLAVGRNPWDLGAVGNWKSVMGNNFLEWVLPIKQSPCRNHESHESQFETGRWMEELLVEVGFMSEQDMRKPLPFSGRKLKGPKPAIMEKSGVAPAMTAECIPRNAH
jgi:palmitoyltransferase